MYSSIRMNRMEFGARDRWIDAAGRRRRARRGLRIEDREEERDDGYANVGNSCGGRRMYLSFSELIHRV